MLTSMTHAELAERIHISPNIISMWKTGKQPIPLKRLCQLANVFGTDPLYIRNLKLIEEGWETTAELDDRVRRLGDLTANEMEFITIIREHHAGNPKMSAEDKVRFKAFVETLDGDTPDVEPHPYFG